MNVRALALFAGLMTGAAVFAAPAQADSASDAFLGALTNAGVNSPDPAAAVALGQSICPMLSQPGQTAGDVAARVADTTGMSLGGANLFTGVAIAFFCPTVVSSIGNGRSPIPLPLLGL
jgi:hypothetical protein